MGSYEMLSKLEGFFSTVSNQQLNEEKYIHLHRFDEVKLFRTKKKCVFFR